MLQGKWIRLDVPYSEKSQIMRGVLAFSDTSGQGDFQIIKILNNNNITDLITDIANVAQTHAIELNWNTELVFPIDSREILATEVEQISEKMHLKFSRKIPNLMSLPVDLETAYENFDTGSPEDELSHADASNLIYKLNNEAYERVKANELLDAITTLKHAMWLSFRFFNWYHPATMYTLKNVGHVYAGTGNRENEKEFMALVLKFIYLWHEISPNKEIWNQSENLFDELATICINMNADELGYALFQMKNKIA